MKKINVFLIYFISLLYMEIIYHFFIYKTMLMNISMFIFLIFISLIFTYISKFFNNKTNKIIFYSIMGVLFFWFGAQYVVKSFFDFNISFSVLQIADQLNDYVLKTIIEVIKRLGQLVLIALPLIISILLKKHINFREYIPLNKIIYILIIAIVFTGYYYSLNINKDEDYSPYTLYHDVNNPSLNIERMGITNTLFVDLYRAIFGFEEKILINGKTVTTKETEYTYNNLDFDFDALINETKDSTVKDMSTYFKNSSGTLQNEYTSFFKGKNLILFMAESFNEIAVNNLTTPTLYKMVNNGFVFENYYTPTIYSTIGGEFQELTGLYANFSSLKTFRSGTNYFPMGIATQFKNSGYNTYAYHDNSYAFQNRDTYLSSLGFTNFKACYNGLEKLITCSGIWPQSDVDMINATYTDYINSTEPFMVFYASVSGHSSYNFSSNAMSKKHKDEFYATGLNYSEPVSAYMAAQMEFDQALELLLEKLEEAGKLDDTVIIFLGDHYPYELTTSQVNEAASYTKDSVVEINKSNLAIYNSNMTTVNVSKVGSTIDVLPTIYNLFGINYDSRLIIGNDILSTEPGLAMFANNSWVSDKGTYFAATSTFVPKTDVDEDYVSSMNQDVQNRIVMSKYIIEKNYYNLIWKYKK